MKTQIRAHQKLRFQGHPNWPPMFAGSGSGPYPIGEDGVLKKVEIRGSDTFTSHQRVYGAPIWGDYAVR